MAATQTDLAPEPESPDVCPPQKPLEMGSGSVLCPQQDELTGWGTMARGLARVERHVPDKSEVVQGGKYAGNQTK